MSHDNVEIVRGLYESFGQGDVPSVLGKMDHAVEWNEAENFIYADGNPYVGPQAVLEGVFMRLGTDWEGFSVTPEEWMDAGNRVIVLGTYAGKHRGTSKQVRAQFAHVWSLKEGRVARFQQYTDTKQFAEVVKES